MPWVEDWMEGCPYQYEFGIITAGYTYHNRLFGIKHFGIEKFQRKWRDYWKKKQEKIMFMKSIKNLKHRAIYGKNPLKIVESFGRIKLNDCSLSVSYQ